MFSFLWSLDADLMGKVKDIELKGHTDSVDQLCWDPKHPDVVATAAGDKTVRFWDARSKFLSDRWPVRTISFNHTGEYIASASEDLFVDISNVQSGRSVHQIPCKAPMNSVEWNPKYNLLAYAGDDKNKYQADDGTVFSEFLVLRAANSPKKVASSEMIQLIVTESPEVKLLRPHTGIH
ncbi:hypothetical protein BHM03_00021761 [Ensete ventricosum]|nr:hypothetical protein BHM03_00021761 [Ensete ventricosum]